MFNVCIRSKHSRICHGALIMCWILFHTCKKKKFSWFMFVFSCIKLFSFYFNNAIDAAWFMGLGPREKYKLNLPYDNNKLRYCT